MRNALPHLAAANLRLAAGGEQFVDAAGRLGARGIAPQRLAYHLSRANHGLVCSVHLLGRQRFAYAEHGVPVAVGDGAEEPFDVVELGVDNGPDLPVLAGELGAEEGEPS